MDSHRKSGGDTTESIISRYEAAMLRYAGLILGSDELAQDAVETAFVRVLKNRDGPADPAELYRVLHSVVVTLAGTRRAAELRKTRSAGTDVMKAVRALRPEEQQVTILGILEGMSNAEISRIAGLSEEMVARLLCKSVMNIAGKLKKAGLL